MLAGRPADPLRVQLADALALHEVEGLRLAESGRECVEDVDAVIDARLGRPTIRAIDPLAVAHDGLEQALGAFTDRGAEREAHAGEPVAVPADARGGVPSR